MKVANFRRVPKMPVYGMAQPTSEVTLLRRTLIHCTRGFVNAIAHFSSVSFPGRRREPFWRIWRTRRGSTAVFCGWICRMSWFWRRTVRSSVRESPRVWISTYVCSHHSRRRSRSDLVLLYIIQAALIIWIKAISHSKMCITEILANDWMIKRPSRGLLSL